MIVKNWKRCVNKKYWGTVERLPWKVMKNQICHTKLHYWWTPGPFLYAPDFHPFYSNKPDSWTQSKVRELPCKSDFWQFPGCLTPFWHLIKVQRPCTVAHTEEHNKLNQQYTCKPGWAYWKVSAPGILCEW